MARNVIRATMAVAFLGALASTLTLGASNGPQVAINAGGATFPYPIYTKWFDVYHKKFPNVTINYNSQGSGFGIQQVTAGLIDFGATDGPMTEAELKQFQEKRGFGVLHFPTVLGAPVAAYNLAGVTQPLNFTPEALAGIFLGKITKWNDPEIANANPGVKLPGDKIVVIRRAESSGTTFIWTDYLSKVSPEWKTKIGAAKQVEWPTGLGAKGNEAVAGQIQQTPNSLGYVEIAYAKQNKMQYGKVKNSAGQFVAADLASITAAAAGAIKDIPDDFRVSITNAPGKTSYPIASFTWLLVPEKIQDANKKKVIVDFLKWMLADGQTLTEALDYAKLPKAIVDKELKAIAKIQ